jgi:hypothetical protein
MGAPFFLAIFTVETAVSILACDYNPQGRPARYQAANSTVQTTKIQMT